MVVVDVAQEANLAIERGALRAHFGGGFGRDIVRYAARNDHIHQQAVPEHAAVEAQQILFQTRELRKTERESAVVAEIPQVAQMVGNPLALEAQRAQPRGALAKLEAGDRLDRLRVGPAVRDRAIARNPRGETGPIGDRQRLETFFDALVRKTQPLFQTEHFLPHHLEAKMSGLDRPGMHRPDGDFVHAVAGHAHKGIVFLAWLPFWRRGEVSPQRKLIDRPCCLPDPGPRVVGVALGADQIERRALHPIRYRKDGRQIGIARPAVRERVLEQGQAVAVA